MKYYTSLSTLAVTMGVALTLTSPLAFAETPEGSIDGDALQQKAEQILESEPGAESVKVRVEVAPRTNPDAVKVTFNDMDLNNDGTLSRDEVGEKLFYYFDQDGNEVIDNLEMKKPMLIVYTPMEKRTIEVVDYGQGKDAKTEVSQEEFLKSSKLSHFDKNKDGLSPLDFLEASFDEVNVEDDGVINMYEWKRAYAASVKPKHMEDFNYNH